MNMILRRLFTSEEDELYFLDGLAYFMILMALATYFILLFENTPYGRYTSKKYGFPVGVKVAWFIQELPAFLVPLSLILWTSASRATHLPNRLLLLMYFCHYVQRSFIYPFLIRGGKPTPFTSFALAFVFCIYNGYLQVRYLSHYAEFPQDWVTHPCFITGCFLWFFGWIVNLHSDHILRNLRTPGETGYKIPRDGAERQSNKSLCHHTMPVDRLSVWQCPVVPIRGGMFEFVSGANFLGEIMEWAGFALAAHSIHSLAFALFTLAILSSRAAAHHKWYLTKFEDYPKSRKALIPFVF